MRSWPQCALSLYNYILSCFHAVARIWPGDNSLWYFPRHVCYVYQNGKKHPIRAKTFKSFWYVWLQVCGYGCMALAVCEALVMDRSASDEVRKVKRSPMNLSRELMLCIGIPVCYCTLFNNYVIVITRAQGMYGIYCTEARGRKPRGLSAIYAMHPECT